MSTIGSATNGIVLGAVANSDAIMSNPWMGLLYALASGAVAAALSWVGKRFK